MSRSFNGRTAVLMAGACVAALATPLSAQAQPATALPPLQARAASEDASASRSPSQIELTGETLARRAAGSADTMSLIAGEPGMAVSANGGISSLPVMRGLADSRVLVTVDGVEITTFCPNNMNPPGSYILPGRVEGISILPTLSPVSAGGDNIAGVIAVTTRAPTFATEGKGLLVTGEVGASYRSVADAVGATVQASVAGERYSIGYEGAWNRAGNYKTGGGRRVRSTLYEAYDQALTLALLTDQGVLSLRAGLRYEGDRFDDDLNTRELSAATEVDLRADWSVSRTVTLYAAAENLFDAKIETAQTGDGLESYDQPQTLRLGLVLRR